MKKHERMPDLIVSSPANRALATARCIAQQLQYPETDIVLKKEAYCSGAGALIDILQHLDEHITAVMLVAHNPDMTGLVNVLCGSEINDMPTCAIAMVRLNIDNWSEAGAIVGELTDYDFPKNSSSR